jgi:hypothetical protein
VRGNEIDLARLATWTLLHALEAVPRAETTAWRELWPSAYRSPGRDAIFWAVFMRKADAAGMTAEVRLLERVCQLRLQPDDY